MAWVKKLKSKWGIASTGRFIVIMVVFSLAGSSILFCKKPVYHALHISPDASLWLKIPVAVMIYQVMLLLWGSLLGEFQFFWEKEKKMARALRRMVWPGTRGTEACH